VERKTIYKYIANIAAAIFAGSIIYFLKGNKELNVFHWFPSLLHFINKVTMPAFVKNNLADGLWLYAFLCSVFLVWDAKPSAACIGWLSFAVVGAVSSEFLQALHLIPGTFDWLDIAAYLIASGFFIINFNNQLQLNLKLKFLNK